MSSSVDPFFNFGPGGVQRFSRNAGRSLNGDGSGTIRYPSPFFDIAQTYLPASFKTMLRWCRYYFLTNPLINAVVYKMAEYPVTDLIFETTNPVLLRKWKNFYNRVLKFKKFEVEAGLDYGAYGNSFISIFYPFVKMLTCRECKHKVRVDKQKYTFREYTYHGECQKCGAYGPFDVFDHYVKSFRDIRLIRWDPEQISIRHNDATGESMYYYTIPSTLRNDIQMGKRHVIERTPQAFIEAIRKNKQLLFAKDNLYHLKRPTIAQKDKGWGLPMILPVLKDVFYLAILRKAQECLTLSSYVDTPDGLRRADEVQVGELVRNHRGEARRISKIRPRKIDLGDGGFAVEISTKAMPAFPTGFSDNHPLYMLRRKPNLPGARDEKHVNTKYVRRWPGEYHFEWVDAGEARTGEYVGYPVAREEKDHRLGLAELTGLSATGDWVYQQASLELAEAYELAENGNLAPKKPLDWYAVKKYRSGVSPPRFDRYLDLDEDLAYIAGWYVGDGSAGNGQVSFALGMGDDHVKLNETLARCLGKAARFAESERAELNNGVLSSSILAKFIKGWIPGTAKFKQVPTEIQSARESVVLSFLRGYTEADGCFYEGIDRVVISTASYQLAYQVWRLLISLECVARITKVKARDVVIRDKKGRVQELPANGRHSYYVILDGSSGRRLRQLLDGVPKARAETADGGHTGFFIDGYFASPIKRWRRIKDEYVLSFQIEEEHTFCVPGMATHNSIAVEHIVPMRVLFPQMASANSDPYASVNLTNWKVKVEQEILRWRLDNNYIPIVPIPMGLETLGGDGRALMLAQEYRVWAEQIVAGLGVPIELVFGGLCLMLDTPIHTEGGFVPLRDLVPRAVGTKPVSGGLTVQSLDGCCRASEAHNVGLKRPYELRTRSGYVLEGAGTHPVCVLKKDLSLGYRNLADLKPGDFVVRKCGADLWPARPCQLPAYRQPPQAGPTPRRSDIKFPTRMSKALARVLGYLVAEGSIDDERVRFSNTDHEIVADYTRCFEEAFGLPVSATWSTITEAGSLSESVELWSRDLSAYLKSIGFWGTQEVRPVPWSILRSCRAHVQEYLKAYFEGDGGLNIKPDGTGCVSATTVSEQLAGETQLLLLNLGFDCSRYWPTKKSHAYKVVVRSQLRKFERLVGFVSFTKRAALAAMPDQPGYVQVPHVRDAVRKLKEKHPAEAWAWRKFSPDLTQDFYGPKAAAAALGRDDHTFIYDAISDGTLVAERRGKHWVVGAADLLAYCKKTGVPERSGKSWPRFYKKHVTLQALRDADLGLVEQHAPELSRRLARLMEGDLRFDEVKRVKAGKGLAEMGDLGVEGEHCYVAGGIVAHNSYSASNVSLRIIENHFLDYKADHQALVQDFVMPNIAAYMGWEPVKTHFKRFKMADDLQRSAFNLQLNQAGKISDQALLEDSDWDSTVELERISEESRRMLENQRRQAVAQAAIQGEAQLVMQKFQIRGQKVLEQNMPSMEGPLTAPANEVAQQSALTAGQPGIASPTATGQQVNAQTGLANQTGQVPPMDNAAMVKDLTQQQQAQPQDGESRLTTGSNLGFDPAAAPPISLDLRLIAQKIAKKLDQLPEHEQVASMSQISQHNPQLASLVQQALTERDGSHVNSAAMPKPSARAPRRGPEATQS